MISLDNNDLIINQKKGILLVYEGISGSGKSEGIHRLTQFLSDAGMKFTKIEWNSNIFIRSLVYKFLKIGILTPVLYSILQWISFLIDYFLIILPALKKNHIVIADRYIYTGITRDVVNGAGKSLSWMLSRIVRKPDWVFFFDTPPRLCYERIKSRGKALFHTNKYIMQHKLLKNKDLFYLKKMRREYTRVFLLEKVNNHLNIIWVNDSSLNIHSGVVDYIFQKMGRDYYQVYNS
ncbi:MAG: Thymidylate kinaselike protein [Bacilli bacterium]|nr:Thymidylate kinaselike protein [Bacilli bacterium]